MICPECKHYRLGKFCEACGTPTLQHNCSSCNKPMAFTDKFCSWCGTVAPPTPKRQEVNA